MLEEEEIKSKKLNELKQQALLQQKQQEKELVAEQQVDYILRQVLTPEAKQRLSNIRLVNKQLYLQVAQGLIQLVKAKQIDEKISDEQLKALLENVSSRGRKEINIKRM